MAAARRISHDQVLTEALTAFLPDFVTLFAPDQATLLDFSQVRCLDKELFTDLAAGDSREVDVPAEVRTREGGPRG